MTYIPKLCPCERIPNSKLWNRDGIIVSKREEERDGGRKRGMEGGRGITMEF